MDEEAGFIAALLAEPDDRTTLLVYADWLDERNDPRAEYLRLLVAEEPNEERIFELWRTFDPIWVRVVRHRCGLGSTVRLTGGPFANSVGEVVGLFPNGPDKVFAAVRITFWGRPIDVEVEYFLIQRVVPAAD